MSQGGPDDHPGKGDQGTNGHEQGRAIGFLKTTFIDPS